MSDIGLRVSDYGLAALFRQLREIDKRVARNAAKRAMRKCGRVILDRAKSKVPVESGALRKALASRPYESKDRQRFAARVGPKPSAKFPVVRRTRGKKRGQWKRLSKKQVEKMREAGEKVLYKWPAKYAHFVEQGSDMAGRKWKRSNRVVKWLARKGRQLLGRSERKGAHPFLRPAMDNSLQDCMSIASSEISSALNGVSNG